MRWLTLMFTRIPILSHSHLYRHTITQPTLGSCSEGSLEVSPSFQVHTRKPGQSSRSSKERRAGWVVGSPLPCVLLSATFRKSQKPNSQSQRAK